MHLQYESRLNWNHNGCIQKLSCAIWSDLSGFLDRLDRVGTDVWFFVCRQLIELWEILLGRVETGKVAPGQWINSAKLASSQLHHVSKAVWIDLTAALRRFALFLLRHKNGWQCGRLLVVPSVSIVLLGVWVELRHFSILFKLEFVRAHYCLLRVSKFVNLIFFLRNDALLILIAALGLIIWNLAHATLRCVKRRILPFALLTERVCSPVSQPHYCAGVLARHLVFDQTFISLAQLSEIRMLQRLWTWHAIRLVVV